MNSLLNYIKRYLPVLKSPLFILCLVILAVILFSNETFAGVLKDTAQKNNWYNDECSLGSWNDNGACLMCPLFNALFNTASKLAAKAYTSFAAGVATLVAIGTAIWIALKILRYVSNMETVEPRQMIQELGVQLFRSMVIVLILNVNYMSVRSLTLDPVFDAGMEITNLFTGRGCAKTPTLNQNGGLSPSMGASIDCALTNIQASTMEVVDLGGTIVCLAFQKPLALLNHIIPSFTALLTGLCLMVLGGFLLLGFPFLLVDCVVNLLFAVSVMPMAVGLYAFKITAQYLGKVWDTFLTAIFNFLFLSLIIYIMLNALGTIFTDVSNDIGVGNGNGVYSIIKGVKGMAFFGLNMLKIAFIFLLAWSSLGEAGKFAGKFGGGGISPAEGIGTDMGAQSLHAGTRLGKGAAKMGGAALAPAVNEMRDLGRRARTGVRVGITKAFGTKSVDEDGNVTYQRNQILGRFLLGPKTTTVKYDKNGHRLDVTTERDLRLLRRMYQGVEEGTKTRTVIEGANRITQLVDKDGNVIRTLSVKLDRSIEEALKGDRNTPDSKYLAEMLAKSDHQEAMAEAIMDKMIAKRINSAKTGVNVDPSTYKTRKYEKQSDGSYTIYQMNVDGTSVTMHMDISEKGLFVSAEKFGKDGRSTKYESNGYVERISRYGMFEKDGKIRKVRVGKQAVGLNDYMRKTEAIDYNGNMVSYLDAEKASYGFKNDEGQDLTFNFKNPEIHKSFMAFNGADGQKAK